MYHKNMADDSKFRGARLGALVETIFSGMVLSKRPPADLSSSLIRVINARDIGDDGLAAQEELNQLQLPATSQTERYQVHEGDVLISARGAFKVGRAESEHSGAIAGPNLVVVRPGSAIESWLLFSFLRHSVIQGEIQRRSVKTTVASINIETIADLRIKIPSMSKQQKLARLVELAEQQYTLGRKIVDRRRWLGHEIAGRELIV